MKQSEFEIFITVGSYDENTAENDRNCYVTEKYIISKLANISIPISDSINVINIYYIINMNIYIYAYI